MRGRHEQEARGVPQEQGPEDQGRAQAREARSAALVAVAILLSKLAGLVRQRVTAHYFGTSAVADAVAAAFRAGNLAQNLLGEGTLSASFIPVYAKLRADGRDEEAVAFARAALGLLSALVVVLSAVGVALAPWLALLVAAGFDADTLALTTELVRVVVPMTGALVLCAWALGVMNAHRRFFLPYVAPVTWSAAQIAALLIGGSWLFLYGAALARALAVGALAGAAIELALLLWRSRPLLGTLWPSFNHRDESVREAARRLPGVLLGRGVIQISGLVDTLLVSFLGTGAAATFTYAQTLYLLPMSLLGVGEAAVSLPEMARESVHHARLRDRLGASVTRVTVLGIGAVALLSLFGVELCAVLLRTGAFDADSTAAVASVLRIYSVGLLANASGRLFATTFFALGEPRVPARFAVVRVVASTAGSLALMRVFGVEGVVAGAVTAGWVEAIFLGVALRGRIGGLGLGKLPVVRLVALAAATCGPAAGLRWLLGPLAHTVPGSLAVLAAAGASFAAAAVGLRLLDPRALLRR
jgi:putative peptidoglycan lipid II flippase